MTEKHGKEIFEEVELSDFADECIKRYGTETIEQRAFVDFHDGLKPVVRRILFTMFKLGLNPGSAHIKSARVVGDTMGKLHPHGDCLQGSTRILISDGSISTIEELFLLLKDSSDKKIGVFALDEKSGSFVTAMAHSFRIGQVSGEEFTISLSDGSQIKCTGNHPFHTPSQGFVQARSLYIGALLTSCFSISKSVHSVENEHMLFVTKIEYKNVVPQNMYDFTVDTYENLLIVSSVMKASIANLVVAHNSSIYSAMVGLANSPQSTVDGSGNWGKINAPAAASRYTNARLSYYAWLNFFNPRYVNVMEYVANYDGKDVEPVVLNGVLPNVLLNGGSGIATAVTSNVPPLKLEGIYNLVVEAMQNEGVVERKSLLKHVRLNTPYGGTVVTDNDTSMSEFKKFLTNNEGSIDFDCDYTYDPGSKELLITGVPPGVNPDNACEWCEEKIKIVDFARDAVDKNTPPGQLKFCILFRKNSSPHDIAEATQKILSRFSSRENYKINVTNRRLISKEDSGLSYDTVGIKFHRTTIPGILRQWYKYRVKLESRALVYEAKVMSDQITRLQLLIFAVKNRKVVLDSLSAENPDAYLIKHLKITADESKQILDLKVRQLSKMDGDKLQLDLDKLNEELVVNKKWQKDPSGRAIVEINTTMEKLRVFEGKKQAQILTKRKKTPVAGKKSKRVTEAPDDE